MFSLIYQLKYNDIRPFQNRKSKNVQPINPNYLNPYSLTLIGGLYTGLAYSFFTSEAWSSVWVEEN